MKWLPLARWAPEWKQQGVVRADLMAGLTGAIVALPQGLAFATLAGMPPHYGLYAAIVPCIIAALFGSSRTMVTGPANAISLTTMALIAPLALPESEHYISLVLTLSLLVGLVQIALGVGGAGKWVEKVPHSVIVGFTFGAAVLIINSQVGTLLGVEIARGTSVIDTLRAAWGYGQSGQIQWWPLGLAVSVLAVLRLWRSFNRIVPAMLVAVVVGSLVAVLLERWVGSALEFRRVGEIPAAIPPFSLPDLSLSTIQQLFGAVLVMVLLASTEAMAIARAMALKSNDRFDANQEFLGQGLANMSGAFFSSFPASGSFNRSGVNFSAGARTPLAAASAGLFLVVILLFVSPLAMHLPYVVIAALLVAVAWGLMDRRQIKREWASGPRESVPMGITALGTVFISLEWAILLGICAALVARQLLPSRH
jgi:sulfate permease, SulP family